MTQPIKTRSYIEIIGLFNALTQIRVTNPTNVDIIYAILSQIHTLIHSFLGDDKEKFSQFEINTRTEKIKFNKNNKGSRFIEESTKWEREMRNFATNNLKEDDFPLGGPV